MFPAKYKHNRPSDSGSYEWQHSIMVQNNNRSKARMSSVSHPPQYLSRTDHV